MNRNFRCSTATAFLFTASCFSICYPARAQLSGAVDLGGKTAGASAASSEQGSNSAKQITVTGVGITPESAEKQAITDAVRQAVGAYVDAKTIVENEAVIKDRILSVSNGFVEEYKVVSPAKQRDDGLYELQILATVQTGQVAQALKENNLISGEVAGANMWAEASTKVMNAQDAVAMLQAKIPELIKSSVTITPLGEDGKPMLSKDGTPNTAPASVKEDAATGKATLIWYLEMGLNKEYYKETLLPLVQQCMDAITGVKAKEVSAATELLVNAEGEFFSANNPVPSIPVIFTAGSYNSHISSDKVVLIKSFSRSFDSWEGLVYNKPASLACSVTQRQLLFVVVKLRDGNGEVLARTAQVGWQPFCEIDRSSMVVGPNLSNKYQRFFVSPVIVAPVIELDLDLLKEIKTVEISMEVPDFTLSLGSN